MDTQSFNRKVSENPLDYASLVLYVKKGVPACNKLLDLAKKQDAIFIQDVDAIQGVRPSWLKGVPTIVDLSNYMVYTGTRSLSFLQEHIEQSTIKGFSRSSSEIDPTAHCPGSLVFSSCLPDQDDGREENLRVALYLDPNTPDNDKKMTLEDMVKRREATIAPRNQRVPFASQ